MLTPWTHPRRACAAFGSGLSARHRAGGRLCPSMAADQHGRSRAQPLALLACWTGGVSCLLSSQGVTWKVVIGLLILLLAAGLTFNSVRRSRRLHRSE